MSLLKIKLLARKIRRVDYHEEDIEAEKYKSKDEEHKKKVPKNVVENCEEPHEG